MALPLKKAALRWDEIALERGRITPESSAQPFLYDISRYWRRAMSATNHKATSSEPWTEKECCVADMILSALGYLHRNGCEHIEQLLKDTLEQHARQSD